jgi:glycyl-tRNA synthetase beta subunit
MPSLAERDACIDFVVVVAQVLTEELGALVAGLSFGKSMRWNGTGAAFSRPVRWLVGLHGARALPFSFAGLQAGAPLLPVVHGTA